MREQPYIWRNWGARSTITIVKSRTEWLLVGLASAGVASITLVPYVAAAGLVPAGTTFSGFLINPVDGYSYLSKMQQGLNGAWGFTLPYAGPPSGSAGIFLFYLALGHLAGVLNIPLLTVYHGTRLLAGFLMFLSIYAFLDEVLRDRLPRLMAFTFVLAGSGLGWLAIAIGIQASDLTIPESIPFVTSFTNPHFPLAVALVALGARSIVSEDRWGVRTAIGLAVGLGLGMVLPFAVLPLIGAGGVWAVWEGTRKGKWTDIPMLFHHPAWPSTAAVALGAAPWFVYDYWVVTFNPVFAVWNAQNLTPSPPVWDYVLGFGLVLVWAMYALWRGDVFQERGHRFLVVWLTVNCLLLYAPFSLQRRFSLGLFVPLAALAGIGVARWVGQHTKRTAWPLIALSLIMSLPSNGLVIAAGLATAASGSPLVTETVGEARAFGWLGEHAEPGAVVLAAPETGIRLPAYAPVRVVAGHPFETPEAADRSSQLKAMFDGSLTSDMAERLLLIWDVSYVFYGPRERAFGSVPFWISGFHPVFEDAGVTIYAGAAP